MNTTNETIFNMGNNEVTTVKPYTPYSTNALRYLYNMRVPFDTRLGVKAIHGKLERHPINGEIIKSLKDFFDSVGMTPHGSGQYPVPEDLEQYQYLEFVNFSRDYCSFTPKYMQNLNSVDRKLYATAVSMYERHHDTRSDFQRVMDSISSDDMKSYHDEDD